MSKCDVCNSKGEVRIEILRTGQKNKFGREIVINDHKVIYCTNSSCDNAWVSQIELDRVDELIAREKRHSITPEQIEIVCSSLDMPTKSAAARFLNLNSKAFTKWSNTDSEINGAYDLLLRLAVFDRKNLKFIEYLHKKNFEFDMEDYQVLCESFNKTWRFAEPTVHVDLEEYYEEDNSEVESEPYFELKQPDYFYEDEAA